MLPLSLPCNELLKIYNEVIYMIHGLVKKKPMYKSDKTLCRHKGFRFRPRPFGIIMLSVSNNYQNYITQLTKLQHGWVERKTLHTLTQSKPLLL